MATKTITIDLEAYERLKSAKRENESFSQTIKRVVRRPFDVQEYFKSLEGRQLSEKAVEAIEEQIRQRHRPSTKES